MRRARVEDQDTLTFSKEGAELVISVTPGGMTRVVATVSSGG